MKKTTLPPDRVLKIVQASSSFEGLYPTERSKELSKAYLNGEISGNEALRRIRISYPCRSQRF